MLAAKSASVKCATTAGHYTARVLSRRVRLWLLIVSLLQFTLLFGLAYARFHFVHQRTFDLALYARIAWGLAHGDGWSPITNTHLLGAHVAPVLLPLGLLGRLCGVVPVLLAAQALAIAACLFPLARIAARRLGTRGVWMAGAALLLYPNLFHVGTYEFHPGTLAVLPMCWAYDAFDRARLGALALALAGVLACREDLAAFAALLALVYYATHRDRRALFVLAAVLAYGAGAIALTLHYAPAKGSLDQHFGIWGGSPLGALRALFTEPAKVFAHFGVRERMLYLPRVLAPLSFFPLRSPRLLLPALPYLALNLVSAFPTADEQYSHYLTPAVPALLVAGIVGAAEVRARFVRATALIALCIAHYALGGSPLSRDFDRAAFREDEATRAARRVLAQIPEHASVQAPDPLLPHLAERRHVRRAPPPEANTAFVALDISHRERFARKELLLRTSEEPLLRKLLARPDHALRVYEPPYALFERGREARAEPLVRSCLVEGGERPDARPLTSCLAIESAALDGRELTLWLRARGPCAPDLALRFGPDPMPGRVELLCGGTLSPALLVAGDLVRARYAVSERGARELRERGLWVGALRRSGAPPAPRDPAAVRVVLRLETP